MSNATNRKTSQTQLKDACDSFFWSLSSLTGGTREETLRQAPRGAEYLQGLADKVAALAANPAKLTLANAWLMERALSVPERLESYKARNLSAPAVLAAAFLADTRAAGDPIHPTQQHRVETAMEQFPTVEVIKATPAAPGEPIPENVIFHDFKNS